MRVGADPEWPSGLRCDRCGREEHQAEMINGPMSILAEGGWAVRWEEPEQHLCPDCADERLPEGFERAA